MKKIARRILSADLPLPPFLRPGIRGLHRICIVIRESYILSKKWLIVSPLMRSTAECGKKLQIERIPYVRGRGRFVIGDRVCLSGKSNFRFLNQTAEEPELLIGSDVFIGDACVFAVANSIEIGDHTLIAGCVRIRDNDGHPLDAEVRRRRESISAEDTAPVVIGENVWIGTGASILKGVKIGDNAVVGAESVVTKDVEANSIVAGNPARVVEKVPGSSES